MSDDDRLEPRVQPRAVQVTVQIGSNSEVLDQRDIAAVALGGLQSAAVQQLHVATLITTCTMMWSTSCATVYDTGNPA